MVIYKFKSIFERAEIKLQFLRHISFFFIVLDVIYFQLFYLTTNVCICVVYLQPQKRFSLQIWLETLISIYFSLKFKDTKRLYIDDLECLENIYNQHLQYIFLYVRNVCSTIEMYLRVQACSYINEFVYFLVIDCLL